MNEIRPNCPRCGAALTPGRTGGWCPACLVEQALAASETSPAEPADVDAAGLAAAGFPVVAAPDAVDRFGDYRLEGEIGRGGMGIIYRAHQVSLNRVVALKMILSGPLSSADFGRRLRLEAEAAARLEHPHIVPIYEVGEHEGQPFYTMRLVEGGNLAGALKAGPFQPRAAARLLATVARAVQHAHERGVLHRDLKPSNILLDREGQPHVSDFGLAKLVAGDSTLTLSQATLGTPSYMAPEQAAGGSRTVTTAADVYSLGAILYELLTGRPLFEATTPLEAMRNAVEREPERPRRVRPELPEDLETICLECLAKEPGRRYGSAGALAEDLERWLESRPIRARPVGWVERGWLWCRRQPALAGLAGLLVMAVAGGLVGVLWQSQRVRATAARERQERERAERTVYRLQVQSAEESLAHGNAGTGLAILAGLLRQNPTNGAVAERLLAELTHRNWPLPIVEPLAHAEPVHHAEFSADGRRILTAALDNTARLWDAATGHPVGRVLEHDRSAVRDRDAFLGGQKCLLAHFSPDGATVVTASVDNTARLWEGVTGVPLTPPLVHPDWVTCVQFSPDGRWVATGCRDGSIRFWEVRTGETNGVVLRHSQYVNFVAYAPDGRRLLSGADDRTGQVWDVETGRPVGAGLRHTDRVRTGGFSADGERVATGSADSSARVWRAASGEALSPPLHHEGAVCALQFSPDGTCLATASFDQTIRLWDAGSGASLARPLEHGGSVRSLEFSPEGRRLLSAAEDKTVRVWDVHTGRPVMEPIRHAAEVWSARFSPDGQRVVTASTDQTCGVWDVRSGAALPAELTARAGVWQVRWSPDGHGLIARAREPRLFQRRADWTPVGDLSGDRISEVAEFSPDGRWVVTGSEDGTARIWDAERGEGVRWLRHGGPVAAACFSPDGKWVLTGSSDGTAGVWDAGTGRRLLTLEHPAPLRGAEFSRDSTRVLTLARDDQVRIWDGTNGRLTAGWRSHNAEVLEAHFSPDGTRVATGSRDHSAQLREAATGRSLGGPLAHRAEVLSVRFSPDGRHLLTASRDNTAVLWNVLEGRVEVVLRHAAAVYSARFSPDGQRIVTSSEDRTARLWDTATGQPLGSPWSHAERVRDAEFSPDGKWVALASGGTVRIWPVPRWGPVPPDELAMLAEAVGGSRESTGLVSESVPPGRWLELKPRLAAIPADSEAAVWLRWLATDRSERAVAPGAALTLPGLRIREEAEATWGFSSGPEVVHRLLELNPAAGWLWAQAARFPTEEFRYRADTRQLREAAWLNRRALALAPDHPAVWWREASTRHYAGDYPGTLQAIARAEGLPGATTRLSLARAQWLNTTSNPEPSAALGPLARATEGRGDGRALDVAETRAAWLARSVLLARLGDTNAAHSARYRAYGLDLAPRDPGAGKRLLDLSEFFTAGLDTDWRGSRLEHHALSALPRGRQILGGLEHDLRGLVQLSTPILERRDLYYPRTVSGIPVHQPCRRLHFLHAADSAGERGSLLAVYTIHREDGGHDTIEVRYGEDVLAWDAPAVPSSPPPRLVWRGMSPAGFPVWLFQTSWTNARPELDVTTIDLTSAMTNSAPFVVAITAE